MSIVNTFYQENREFSEDDLLKAIINTPELTPEDLWLLPQYVFDEWRKIHDYPRIIDNFKRRLKRFEEWMKTYSLTDAILMDGYISNFVRQKYIEGKNDRKFHLVKVTSKGKPKHQVWPSYDKEKLYTEDEITYEYIIEFISYLDWCEINKIENLEIKIERVYQASDQEEVYYNFDLRLLKMGGIEPPKNGLGQILRSKKMEFVNVSGLKLNDEIRNRYSIEFIFSTVDNMTCNHLKVLFLTFDNSSVRNLSIENSDISNWKFINSNTSGRIKDSSIKNTRIWGGQFIPVFENTEPENFGVWHASMKHSKNFDRTYRAFYKANRDIGNYREASKFKILELDFKRSKAEGLLNKIRWNIDKYFWEYGQNPSRIILVTLFIIFLFGFIYSFFPNNFKDSIFTNKPYIETLGNTLYYSVVTFTTLGYGDIIPTGIVKFIAAIEALLGAITMGFLVVSLGKIKD